MAKRTKAQLKTKVDQIIKPNGNREITPEKHNSIETDIIDSFINIADGGFVIDQAAGYSTEVAINDDRQFASKKYVDDADQGLQNQIDNFEGFDPNSDQNIMGDWAFTKPVEVADASSNEHAVNLGQLNTELEDYTEGAVSSTDNAIVRFDGTTGKIIQNSTVIIEDDGTVKMTDTTLKSVLNVPSSGIIAFGADFTYCYVPVNIGRPGKSGTDVAGDSYTISSGAGSGAGAESLIKFATPTLLASGSTAQTVGIRMQVGSWVGNLGPGFCALYLGNGAATGANYSLLYSSSALIINHTSLLEFKLGAYGLPMFTVGGSTVTFGGRTENYIGITVKAHATQAADLTRWTNSSNTILGKIDKDGNATFPSLTITQPTPGSNAIYYSTTNTTSSVRVVQNRVTTTNDTVTTLQSVAIPTDLLVICDVDVSIIRTGGSSGSAGDKAGAKGWFIAKNVGGTVTIQDSSISLC